MKRILFVCFANVCRSPLAEGIAKHIIAQRGLEIVVDSAGIRGMRENESPCPSAIKIAQLHGVDITSIRAKKVKVQDVRRFDFVVAMDRNVKGFLDELGFKNIFLMGEFGNLGGIDIPDPYHKRNFDRDIRDIYRIYEMIENGVEDLMEKVKSESLFKSFAT